MGSDPTGYGLGPTRLLPSFRRHSQGQLAISVSHGPAVHWRVPDAVLGFNEFARGARRTQENSVVTRLLAYGYNSQMEEKCGARYGEEGVQPPCPLWVHHPPRTSMGSPSRSSPNLCFSGGYLRRLHYNRHERLNHGSLVTHSASSLSSLSGRWGLRQKLPTLSS